PNMQVLMIGPVVAKPVNQPRVAVEIEDHRLIGRKQTVKVAVTETVRMAAIRLQLEEIHYVDKTHLEIRKLLPQHRRGRQRFFSGNVSGARHDYVRFLPLIVAGLGPDAYAFGAMRDGGVHLKVLKVHLLVAYDHIDVVLAAQTMIRYR